MQKSNRNIFSKINMGIEKNYLTLYVGNGRERFLNKINSSVFFAPLRDKKLYVTLYSL